MPKDTAPDLTRINPWPLLSGYHFISMVETTRLTFCVSFIELGMQSSPQIMQEFVVVIQCIFVMSIVHIQSSHIGIQLTNAECY